MKKTTKARVKSKSRATPKKIHSKQNWYQVYVQQRDAFFHCHPLSRLLIGIFIVAFSILVGVLYANAQYKALIVDVLSSEGVPTETISRVLTNF